MENEFCLNKAVPIMEEIILLLKKQYDIDCIEIVEILGGLSASAYKIKTTGENFFLKVYHKKLTQTKSWIENIDNYMPVLLWLNKNTSLRGKISNPMITKNGRYRIEDDENVYILFDYIDGNDIAGKTLTQIQIIELAEIMGQLHNCGKGIPVNIDMIKENFEVPFCSSLEKYITDSHSRVADDIIEILQPFLEQLMNKIHETYSLAKKVGKTQNEMVICHTDAHCWNIMQSDHIVLIDWEGMKMAPAEADLFMFAAKEYWNTFMKHYCEIRPGFELDQNMMAFYSARRKLEDIWVFLEKALYDDLSYEQRKSTLEYLLTECKDLNAFGF